jgi:hypothetical protein
MKSKNKYNRKISILALVKMSNYKKEKGLKKEKKMPMVNKGKEKKKH